MEDGTITLVGATTENPSFELNGALLSRATTLVLNRLDDDAMEELITRVEKEAGRKLPVDADARTALIGMADGDGRAFINLCEEVLAAVAPGEKAMTTASLVSLVQRRAPLYDKSREGHYNLISALHKAVRGSDPDAALYWLCRMLDGGENRLFLARRLVRMAIEDIGLADPAAITQALAAKETYDFLGSPEGERARADHDLSRDRTVERGLHGLWRRHARGQEPRLTRAAEAHSQRTDQAHVRAGLRRRLRIRPRNGGRLLRQDYFLTRWSVRPTTTQPSAVRARDQKRLTYWQKLRDESRAARPPTSSIDTDQRAPRGGDISPGRKRLPSATRLCAGGGRHEKRSKAIGKAEAVSDSLSTHAPSPGCWLIDPLGLLDEDNALRLDLCDLLEHIADGLPENATPQLAHLAFTAIERGWANHVAFEEEALFPILHRYAAGDPGLDAGLRQLAAEHAADAGLDQEIVDTLHDLARGGPPRNPEMVGYLLRAHFVPMRRHILWENAFLLPAARRLLSDDEIAMLRDWIRCRELHKCTCGAAG